MRRYLRIGEAAQLLGVSTKTIRHYQEIGLLPEPTRSEGGYRLYDGQDIDRLLRIRRLAALGLPLSQVRSLLAQAGDRAALRRALSELRDEIFAEIETLSLRRSEIDRLLAEESEAGIEGPRRPPADVDAALSHLRQQLTGIDPVVLDRALDLDRKLFGLLYELKLPEGAGDRLRDLLGRLAADPSPMAGLLPLLGRFTALADLPEDSPEVEPLAAELAAALPRVVPGPVLGASPLSEVLGEITRGALSPAQARLLSLVRERLEEAAKGARHRTGRP